ncbi:pilus assembly protein [soil metagenome]
MSAHSRRRTTGREGSAAIEFALIAPVFLLMICGMVVYGSWFSLAQSVQSLATEAARASIGGLDIAERRSLATAYVEAHKSLAGLDAAHVVEQIDVTDSETRVAVLFDTTDHPVRAMSQLIPSPPAVIERTAVVLSGTP